jgi:hypothetical protein
VRFDAVSPDRDGLIKLVAGWNHPDVGFRVMARGDMDGACSAGLPQGEAGWIRGQAGLAAGIVVAGLCSVVLHIMVGVGFELPSGQKMPHKRVITLDLTPQADFVSPPAPPVERQAGSEDLPSPEIKPRAAASAKRSAPKAARSTPRVVSAAPTFARINPKPSVPAVSISTPVSSPTASSAGAPVLLANESGQDALKHGSEARFMHGLATEEFVEDNYAGSYFVPGRGRVWIEDDRARSGHLVLHDDRTGFSRPLFRFNRFIYVYGESPDSSSPVLGSVTFLSDGTTVSQFIWQHNSTQAYYPARQ